jgi:hypothetical protein
MRSRTASRLGSPHAGHDEDEDAACSSLLGTVVYGSDDIMAHALRQQLGACRLPLCSRSSDRRPLAARWPGPRGTSKAQTHRRTGFARVSEQYALRERAGGDCRWHVRWGALSVMCAVTVYVYAVTCIARAVRCTPWRRSGAAPVVVRRGVVHGPCLVHSDLALTTKSR